MNPVLHALIEIYGIGKLLLFFVLSLCVCVDTVVVEPPHTHTFVVVVVIVACFLFCFLFLFVCYIAVLRSRTDSHRSVYSTQTTMHDVTAFHAKSDA